MIKRVPPVLLGPVTIWRLDQGRHATTWDSGEGAYLVGGRWNAKGVRAVYCSLDPATAILEVAVHKGFRTLDRVAHVLTKADVVDPSHIFVVDSSMIPNKNWLHPCIPSSGQQAFGNSFLAKHRCVLIPSVVSVHSWNLIFDAHGTAGFISNAEQEPFSLDTRLDPA